MKIKTKRKCHIKTCRKSSVNRLGLCADHSTAPHALILERLHFVATWKMGHEIVGDSMLDDIKDLRDPFVMACNRYFERIVTQFFDELESWLASDELTQLVERFAAKRPAYLTRDYSWCKVGDALMHEADSHERRRTWSAAAETRNLRNERKL